MDAISGNLLGADVGIAIQVNTQSALNVDKNALYLRGDKMARPQQASKKLCKLIKKGISDELEGKDFWAQMRDLVEKEGFNSSEDIVNITYTAFNDEDHHLSTLNKVYKKHCKVR